ncbi:MAG: hypothetical protein WBB56_09330, partial [Psychrobacillus psychrotolerans]
HLGCAILCAFVFSLTATGVLFIAILISFVYATIFFIIDNLSRYIEGLAKNKGRLKRAVEISAQEGDSRKD